MSHYDLMKTPDSYMVVKRDKHGNVEMVESPYGYHPRRSQIYPTFDDARIVMEWLIERAAGYPSLKKFENGRA